MEKHSAEKIVRKIAPMLRAGAVGVFPTDTLYGVVGSALKKETVERIYKLRRRDLKKPLIILIASLKDLDIFGIRVSQKQKETLVQLWPGKFSVVFPCPLKKFEHLHRGGKTLAFRLPDDELAQQLLKKTGPLVAPSANRAGDQPAYTYDKARKYFTDTIDFYVDAGTLKSKPSTVMSVDGEGKLVVLREGAGKLKK